jgi:secretion/DNA translocation related TadE-like protein
VRARRGSSEWGAGSVLVLCAVAVVLSIVLGVAVLASGYHARHRAAAAADLAALAAAGHVRSGESAACAVAGTIAKANGGVLRRCETEGWQVVVAVGARITGPAAWLPDPIREARAGPAPVGPAVGGDMGRPTRLMVPVDGAYRSTARFGDTGPHWASGRHTGLDFAAEPGTPVLAAAGGRILAAGPAGSYGNLVTIDHGGVVTYYAHLSVVGVAAGQIVAAGQQVGAVGSTGNATGPHLHFEVRVDGVARDPAAFLPGRAPR